jgi:hypothetical protein
MERKMVLALIATVAICLLLSTPVLAAKGDNGKSDYGSQPCWGYGDKPGWGYGDTNHGHCGPPGWGYGDKPGWGYGDTNHNHYGPQGKCDDKGYGKDKEVDKPGLGHGDKKHYHYGSPGQAR